ncbi:CRP/FNR family transcriptional regulator, anaerobic regulatory protein [Pedobacter antarcticus]|uniref:CRP/FNR family transcriptional regulator, anaerobic regulatory protein n=1 Tax=Pedobacter antarcticus TaxID=34086 RepID=A0A1I2GCV5_9SPHI|nr:Crp/Fnr family transcriptional regulator [Pedobacter antarcticus]SFF15322.1 CRP/FNR family transcriptional regulator, anaerobic regulatory protein [Pedobacter antarcticus]
MNVSITNYIDQVFPQFEPALKELLINQARLKTFAEGEFLMETGQYLQFTVLIVAGRVKLYRNGEDGTEFFMYELEPGNACALSLSCAIKQQQSEVTAKAIEKTIVLLIPIGLMDNLMQEYKSWYYFVMDTYRLRFEELLEVIDNVTFKALDERLFAYLKHQSEKLGTNHLQITHQEIATDLNSSREVISRILKKMEQKGHVKLNRNAIERL